MEGFFAKYSVELDERNAVEHIHEHFKCVKKAFEKSKEKGYAKMAHHLEMVKDFFEAAGVDPADYAK